MPDPDTTEDVKVEPSDSSSDGEPVRPTFLRNIFTNWLYYLVVLVTGFLVPRLIHTHQGQELLGVWDFGWSLVSYVTLLSLGVVSSVNRYVARHRAVQDWEALNVSVNSSLAILLASFLVAGAISIGFALACPLLLPEASPELLAIAKMTVLWLTLSASMKLPLGVLDGVLTGYERYDVLNLIRGVRDIVSVACALFLLSAGHGLAVIAFVFLCGEALAGIVKIFVVGRICATLRFAPSLVRVDAMREMIGFGGKTMLQGMARMGLYYANSLLVAFFLGPAVLAVYTRQRSLVMHAMRFMKKYSHVFVPTSGRLDAQGDRAGLQSLLIQSSRYGFYISLPIAALLVIMGGPLIHAWMGPSYQAPMVLAILSIGHVLSLPQQSAYSILMGMGRHGVPSIAEFLAALCGIVLCAVAMGRFDGGMASAALAIALPVTLVGGLLTPMYACRVLGVQIWRYVGSVTVGPSLAVVPFVLILLLARWAWPEQPVRSLVIGTGGGGLILAVVYWTWVVPPALRVRIARAMGVSSRLSPASTATRANG